MTELEQIEAGLAALEAQRGLLGDTVVEMAAAPLRARLATLQTEQASAAAQQLKQVHVDSAPPRARRKLHRSHRLSKPAAVFPLLVFSQP